MRHRRKINHLGRKSAHRQAMLSNMAASLILHKRIKTTLQKAKALRVYVEPLINRSKDNTTHSRRIVFSYLQNKEAVAELFRDVADKVADRPGGYTRILKIENRLGDNAEMCYIELVDYNANMLKTEDDKKKATRRSRRGSGKSTTTESATTKTEKTPEKITEEPETTVEAPAEEVVEAPVAEAPEAEVEEVEVAEAPEPEVETVAETPEPEVEVVAETPEPEAEVEIVAETPEPEVEAVAEMPEAEVEAPENEAPEATEEKTEE